MKTYSYDGIRIKAENNTQLIQYLMKTTGDTDENKYMREFAIRAKKAYNQRISTRTVDDFVKKLIYLGYIKQEERF